MSGRVYRVPFPLVAVTAQQDFLTIVSASTKVTELLELHASQTTEVGDAMEEGLNLAIKQGATSNGSGGGTVTPVPAHLGDAAFAGSARRNDTTPASGGTIVTHQEDNWNIRMPMNIIFTPETTIWIPPSARLVWGLLTTPADSISVSGYALIREYG